MKAVFLKRVKHNGQQFEIGQVIEGDRVESLFPFPLFENAIKEGLIDLVKEKEIESHTHNVSESIGDNFPSKKFSKKKKGE